ncbi:MAG: hypothetical protein HC866_10425 [Leptolyngbyaceae cyanobacterium RU_5_1]|nr:hypothetical protein [Leptolyngbyaceae cyanobacterium RU_5_1]
MKTSVLKAFGLSILMLVVSALLITDLAFSNPLPQKYPLIAQTPEINSSFGAPQPAETSTAQPQPASENQGDTVKSTEPLTDDQTSPKPAREKASATAPADERSQPTKPRTKDAFDAFNRALYGS